MLKLARWSTTHRKYVVSGWIALLFGVNMLAQSAGTSYSNNFTLPNSDSQRAADLLQRSFPAQAGDRDTIVYKVSSGTVLDPAVRARMSATFARVAKLPHVAGVIGPYAGASAGKQISADGQIAFATVVFDQKANLLPKSAAQRVVDTARAAERRGLQVELGGQAIESTDQAGFGLSTAVGLLAAIVVLLLTFGSLTAMGLPIVTALFGLGTGLGAIALFTHVVDTPDFSSELAAMIGLGVGIDYALFILTRFREAYRTPGPTFADARESVVRAMDTAGRAVLFAGTTVVIALLGMMLLGVDFLYGVAISASIGVLLVMLASLTLLPALLTIAGARVARPSRRARAREAREAQAGRAGDLPPKVGGATGSGNGAQALAATAGTSAQTGNGAQALAASAGTSAQTGNGAQALVASDTPLQAGHTWLRWSAFVQRRPWTIALASTLVMLLIAAPAMALRLGSSDAANDPANQTTHRAYELLAQGFGEGFNGPLLVVAKVPNPGGRAADQSAVQASPASPPAAGPASVEKLRGAIAATPGVVAVAPAKLNPAGDVATITVYPHSSPQAYATTQLVSRLRHSVVPPVQASTGMRVYVGGVTAGAVDFATVLGHKLPLFIGVVVLLSALLLMIVFRSLVIPLQAAAMNLLSITASLGVIVAIFQWGWLGGLLGVQRGPIESFIPVMLFAIVFGLSMDYEVFLISRMHERWVHTREHSRAVAEGLALTGRVVTAAAAIMVCVFLSFMLGDNRVIKEFGLSLASAVLLDALVVRCLLLPAVLHLVGERTWWIPAWLARGLPRLNIEGTVLPSDVVDGGSPGGAPALPGPASHPRSGVATEGAEG
jgi:RND superfamily putative drug exporter